MDGFHPDMQALAEQLAAQRQSQALSQAVDASRASQDLAKRETYEHEMLRAARLAGA